MKGIDMSGSGLDVGRWQVCSAENISLAEAEKFSCCSTSIPGAEELIFHDHMSDLSKNFPEFKPGRSTALAWTTVNVPSDCRILISAGADWWMHGFVNGKPFGDTAAAGNCAHPITESDHFYTADLSVGKNRILFYLQAGLTWDFGVQIFPIPENWPQDHRKLMRMCQAIVPQDHRLLHEPVVHSISCDHARITTEFSRPVLASLHLHKQGCSEDVREFRNTLCGQWEYQQMNCFFADDLETQTVYEYQIFCRNEDTAEDTPVFSGEFTTFPKEKREHTFAAFSDLQFPEEEKKSLIGKSLLNTPAGTADFIVSLGDMASGFTDFSAAYFSSFTDFLKQKKCDKPLVFARGNHELWGEESSLYSRFLGKPFGTFCYGDVFYFVLDTGEDQIRRQAPGSMTQRSYMADYYREQRDFLAKAIQTPECRNARLRIVLAHGCPFEFELPYCSRNIREFAGEFFYGSSPLCKIDLWLCGDIHSPYRYDPAGGNIYGISAGRTKPAIPTANDLRDIRFPVYVNDGPLAAGADFSLVMAKISGEAISLCSYHEDGSVVDQLEIFPGRPFDVKSTEYELLWSK